MDDPKPDKCNQTAAYVLIATWLPFCWYAMQLLHELGHLAAAQWFGVEVKGFYFGLLTISYTMLDYSGHSPSTLLAVTWAGPVAGMLLPTAIWGIAALLKCRDAFLARFLAGFCLVANGCYFLFGPADALTDTGVLLANGAMRWQLAAVGISGIVSGFLLWNRQGSDFGFGKHRKTVHVSSVLVSLLCFVVMLAFLLCRGM